RPDPPRHRPAVGPVSDAVFVSVVVPTWNRADLLPDCLRSLRAQDYPADRFEIVVLDNGSSDATADVVRPFMDVGGPSVRYVRLERHGSLNVARNAAIAAAHGDPICFVDDDVD